MKKYFVFIVLLILISHTNYAQNNTTDSLKQLLLKEKSDTNRVLILAALAYTYSASKPDSTILLSQQGLTLARELKFSKGEARCLNQIGISFEITGNYPKALEILLQALKIYENINDKKGIGACNHNIGIVFMEQGDIKQYLEYTFKSKMNAETLNNNENVIKSLISLGDGYEKLNQLDSARIYTQQAYELAIRLNYINKGMTLCNLGNIHSKMQQGDIAMGYYRLSLPDLIAINDDDSKCEVTLWVWRNCLK
ncbi:MAG TPA: tetratricopeptide repeat protein [Ignavibacteria bacterium]